MTDYHISVFYSEEDGGYIADIPDLKSCSAFGKTPEEAVREAMLAKRRDFKQPAHDERRFPRPATARRFTRRVSSNLVVSAF